MNFLEIGNYYLISCITYGIVFVLSTQSFFTLFRYIRSLRGVSFRLDRKFLFVLGTHCTWYHLLLLIEADIPW
jgi:hypothetical protein